LEVEIEQTDKYEIIVEADDNIIPYIVTEISGGKLEIYFKNVTITDFKKAKIYVKLPKISRLKATSSSSIKTTKAIKSEKLNLDASSSGDIILAEVTANTLDIDTSSASGVVIEKVNAQDLNIESSSAGNVKIEHTETPKISLSASSSSDITIKGKTKDLRVEASSASGIKAKDLQADNVTVNASSNSEVYVFPIVSLTADASSVSEVYYYNKPKDMDKSTSSNGTIKQR